MQRLQLRRWSVRFFEYLSIHKYSSHNPVLFTPKLHVRFCLLSLYWIDRMLAFNIFRLLLVNEQYALAQWVTVCYPSCSTAHASLWLTGFKMKCNLRSGGFPWYLQPGTLSDETEAYTDKTCFNMSIIEQLLQWGWLYVFRLLGLWAMIMWCQVDVFMGPCVMLNFAFTMVCPARLNYLSQGCRS